MNWKHKAAAFRLLSGLPFGSDLHFLLQRKLTREWPRRAPALDELLQAARTIRADAERHLPAGAGAFVEIGAGRDLAVAVALRMLGVGNITCVDVQRLARIELVQHAAAHMARRLGMPLPALRSWDDLRAFGITYVAPCSLQEANLAADSADCFYTVDTLEHIPPGELRAILLESGRILRAEGLGIHLIDYSDHFARGTTLSRFNFLRYTERGWDRYNSPLQFVNRLRHSDYLALTQQCGYVLLECHAAESPPEPEIIEGLAPEFLRYSTSDLFTRSARIVARRSSAITNGSARMPESGCVPVFPRERPAA